MLRLAVLALFLALAAPAFSTFAQSEPKPGGFGFAIEVDAEGFFLNPTLKTVIIKSVVPGRPAFEAGIKPGDQVVAVEGKQVAGAKGRELEPLLKKNVGETLALRLRRPSGEVYMATFVAAPQPN